MTEQLERLMLEATEKGFRMTWLTRKGDTQDRVQIDSTSKEDLQAFRDRFLRAVEHRYGEDITRTVKAHMRGLASGLGE